MSPRPHSSPKRWTEAEIDEKHLLDSKTSLRQQPKRLLAEISKLLNVIPQLCDRREKHRTRRHPGHRKNTPMSLLVRADNGSKWKSIGLDDLSFDPTVGDILVSEELAEMLLTRGDFWRRIRPKTVKDELKVNHVCEHALKISYRWGNETSTRDAKIYVSSALKEHDRKNGNGSLTRVNLLVPKTLDTQQTESASTVQPNYHLPPQTQPDKDRERERVALANKAHAENMKATQIKKEKKFEEALKKPATVT
ncbi:hypothetical protein PV04_04015 [Phialophora macrospora]|uniref:Uncharacterized protein n=1 Tax=Phialophora macrospora TaxID=1851006 RepID=A0A0D2FN85_9EURO|nr:hypothetical protein PV04_04015 [Phialophora macrospora]